MQVELKRIQVSTRLSEETIAFAADVWIDGKKAGTAKNDGHGGATSVHIHDPATAKRLNEFSAPLVPEKYKRFTSGDEWIVDQLLQAHLTQKEDKRIAKATAKHDARYKEMCAIHKTCAARFKAANGDVCWMEFGTDGVGSEKAARALAEKKFGPFTDWTVIAGTVMA